jgi:hypothetical protein
MYSQAQGFDLGNVGYLPYTGQTQAPLTDAASLGLQNMTDVAGQQMLGNYGMQGINAATGVAPGMIQQAASAPDWLTGQGSNLSNEFNLYQTAANQAQGQTNPYLQTIMDQMNRRIGDTINSQFSGAGREGSSQQADTIARALSESEAPIMAQDYEARQQRLMQAAQGELGVSQNAENIGQALNQMGGQWAQLSPQLAQAQYIPSGGAMNAGDYQQQRAQDLLNQQIQQYNTAQAYPWQQLERESAILAGAGQLGGQQQTSSSTQVPWTQRVLGGGLAGAGLGSAFGPIGAGVGAGAGGLLGLL